MSKVKKLLIALIVVIVIGAGVGGAYYATDGFKFASSDASSENESEESKESKESEESEETKAAESSVEESTSSFEETASTEEIVPDSSEEVVPSTEPETEVIHDNWYDDSQIVRSDLNYEDMEYGTYDPAVLDEMVDALTAALAESDNEEAVLECTKQIVSEYDRLYTLYHIANNRHYSDVNSDEYNDVLAELNDTLEKSRDKILIQLREALNGEYKDILAEYIGDEELVEDILEYEDMTEEELALSNHFTDITIQYSQALMQPVTFEHKGEIWDMDRLNEEAGNLNYFDLLTIYNGIEKAQNDVLAPMYLDVIDTMNKMAALDDDYDTAAEALYEGTFCRDYTPEESRQLHAIVKEVIVPLHQKAQAKVYASDKLYDLLDMPDLTVDYIIEKVGSHLDDVDPELSIAYNYMKEHNLYDIDYTDSKMSGGYTTELAYYNVPFIFNCPGYNYYDIETMIHEYGHYNFLFHHPMNMLFESLSFDFAEIHSQGLEVLFLEYADDIYGKENGNTLRLITSFSLLDSIVSGCMYDEFQQEVYEASLDHELNVTEVNQIMRRVGEEYGQTYMNYTDEAYNWVQIPHTFQSPFYYISYATSALNALDILAISQENRDDAINTYMKISATARTTPYKEVMEQTGLRDIFQPENVKAIAADVEKYINSIK